MNFQNTFVLIKYYFYIFIYMLKFFVKLFGGGESFISNPLQNNHKPKLENSLGLYSFLMVTFSSNNKSNINNDKI